METNENMSRAMKKKMIYISIEFLARRNIKPNSAKTGNIKISMKVSGGIQIDDSFEIKQQQRSEEAFPSKH